MVLISACLAGKRVRYDGTHCANEEILEMIRSGEEFRLICPELSGGLDTPREPSEICGGSAREVLEKRACIKNKKGEDVTDSFLNGAYKTLELAQKLGADRIYLKSKSPSCGFGCVYDGAFSGNLKTGNGVTAELLFQNGFRIISV